MKSPKAENSNQFRFTVIREGDSLPVWREELELMFVLQGRGGLAIDNQDLPYQLGEGDLAAVNSFQLHRLELESGSMVLSLLVSREFLALFCPEIFRLTIDCKSFLFPREQQQEFDIIRHDFAAAFRAYYKNESPLPVHIRSKIVVLLDDLIHYFQKPREEGDPKNDAMLQRLRETIDYLHRNYREGITLGEAAKEAALSPYYLSRLFQKQLGQTFTGYLTTLRLNYGVTQLRTDTTITGIAYDAGFPSANAFIGAFKERYKKTPGQYRKEQGRRPAVTKKPEMTEDNFSSAFASLLKHVKKPAEQQTRKEQVHTRPISVNVTRPGRALTHAWRFMINAGYARDLQNAAVQKQIIAIQREIGFTYLRCKGILDDDMMVCLRKSTGELAYNFVYLDEMIDFICSLGLLPFLEFSFMPSALAERQNRMFQRPSIFSMPRKPEEWIDLVETLLRHFAERYGPENIRNWIFCPFANPEFARMGFFTNEAYRELYRETTRTIRRIDGGLRICGPGSGVANLEYLGEFLDFCTTDTCLPDILAFHSFHESWPGDEDSNLQILAQDEAFLAAMSGDERFLEHSLSRIRELLQQRGLSRLPLLLNEWNSNLWQRDLCNDTSYKSAFLFKNILENYDNLAGFGYWSLSDQMEEIPPYPGRFYGGFGLFTRDGFAKSAYRALELLRKAGDTLVQQGDGWFITSGRGGVQIFLYNYGHYDMLYRYRHVTHISKTERYNVFNAKQPELFHIRLQGLGKRRCRVSRYSVGPAGGSVYDAWLQMGAPERTSPGEDAALDRLSHPVYTVEEVDAGKELILKALLRPHEIQLITIT
jgi:xylan 1,4-beta-xylosidase